MRAKLVTALRTAAKALEDGTFYYDWSKANSCNCGVLFCALTGRSASGLMQVMPPTVKDGTWRERVGYYCPVTGVPENELFKELFSCGLTAKDIVHLEYLNDPKVREKMGSPLIQGRPYTWLDRLIWRFTKKPVQHYAKRVNTIAYMRAWADLIAEQDALDMPEGSSTAEGTLEAFKAITDNFTPAGYTRIEKP